MALLHLCAWWSCHTAWTEPTWQDEVPEGTLPYLSWRELYIGKSGWSIKSCSLQREHQATAFSLWIHEGDSEWWNALPWRRSAGCCIWRESIRGNHQGCQRWDIKGKIPFWMASNILARLYLYDTPTQPLAEARGGWWRFAPVSSLWSCASLGRAKPWEAITPIYIYKVQKRRWGDRTIDHGKSYHHLSEPQRERLRCLWRRKRSTD